MTSSREFHRAAHYSVSTMLFALKQLFILFKGGIVIFVLIGGLACYALGDPLVSVFSWTHLLLTLLGLAALSAGSFTLNQVQEIAVDKKMNRTRQRPLATAWMSSREALWLGIVLLGIGLAALYLVSPLAAVLGFITVSLYNGFYTIVWKKKWAFGAVPGAVPGAMPVVIGYAAICDTIFTQECFYLFLILFLWQMPHFWAIAVKLREDYERGGVPVLPVKIGVEGTLFHIGLYTFCYVALAMASPWFVPARYAYMFLVIPVVCKLLWQFLLYMRSRGEQGWLPFFLWTNLSVLVFLIAPVIDKWTYILAGMEKVIQ
mgnify:CR=1 FL=1